MTSTEEPSRVAVLFAGLLVVGTAGCASLSHRMPETGCQMRANLDPRMVSTIDEFRQSVPALMRKGDVPGCAIALVDAQGIIWAQGYGWADRREHRPVTPDTIFDVMSISKALTATAALLAVQDGLLDLDEPITRYLPDFHVNSRDETSPEGKITLRHLLSHTSGLQQDAPIGNPAEPTGTFEEHVGSLCGTWLRFPVGRACYYSNAGVDLAAYVLQVVSGLPFDQYLRQRVFSPLGMSHSTVTRQEWLASTNRALGHTIGVRSSSYPGPILGAAGVYSSVADLAKFVQLHLNDGIADGPFLKKALLEGTYVAQASRGVPNEPETFCGVGIMLRRIHRRDPDRRDLLVYHGGSGLGYTSLVYWYPEYGFGGVALADRFPDPSFGEATLQLANLLIERKLVPKRIQHAWSQSPACVGPFPGETGRCHSSAGRQEWREHCGTYRFRTSGYEFKWYARWAMGLGIGSATPSIKVSWKNGSLRVTESRFLGRAFGTKTSEAPLQEITPGLFMTPAGDCLDFTVGGPRYNNYRLEKR